MSGLHFVRTGIPDTPKTPLSASSFHEYYSDTPRHHPDIPKTTPRHLQGTQDVNRRQHAPTDTSEHTQTAPVSVWGCLLASVVICCRLLISWVPWRCLGGIWGLSGGIWGVFMETGGTQTCLKGIWDSSPYNMEPLHYFGTALKRTTFFAWPYWGIKISKCLYIRFTKIIGL